MNIILAAHGKLAPGVVDAANLVFGQIDHLDVVTFEPGQNAETLKKKYHEIIDPLAADEEILFLVDLFGGSPYNAAFEVAANQERMDIITGLSIPMLIDVIGLRTMNEEIKAQEVYESLGKDTYIKSCKNMLKANAAEAEEEDEL